MINRRTVVGWSFAALASLAIAGEASAQSISDIKAKGRLVVGALVDFPPYGLTNSSGEPEGFDIDVAKELGRRMGTEVEIVPVSGPNRIPYLLSSRVDMLVASLGITPEREKQVDFSNPYERLNAWMYARKELDIKGYPDMAGHTFAVARGSTDDLALSAKAPPTTVIMRFDDDASTRQAIRSQQVDGASASDMSIAEYDKAIPGVYERKFALFSQVQGVGIRKGQTELLDWVNAQIAAMVSDGTLESIRMKWIGQGLLDLTQPSK